MSAHPIKVIILGAHGRMGQALVESAKVIEGLEVVGKVGIEDNLTDYIEKCDAVIDFTHADVTTATVEVCLPHRKALVIGTTGQDEAARARIAAAAQDIPIVFAPNFSVGVNTLFWLTRKAAEILGPDFDLEVVEMHHRLKKDSPSGTARRLAEILAEARELNYARDVRHGREGMVGERTQSEIGMHAIRGGDVIGDHTVIFATPGERVELTHKASNRNAFAVGALRAAIWATQRPAGLYDMQDVLGLK